MEKIVRLQVALFFENLLTRPDKLYPFINENVGNLFDEMPQIVPLPLEAPPEVPRVTLRDRNGRFICNISLSRIDFIFNENKKEEDWAEVKDDFLLKAKLFIRAVYSKQHIVRFGLIGNFFLDDQKPSTTITKKYFKVNLETAEEINLRFNKRFKKKQIILNNIFVINTAYQASLIDNSMHRGIFIERDINNIPSEDVLKQKIIIEIIEEQLTKFTQDAIRDLVK